ncbi:uncharacterized protein LOC121865212 [Homarus americanus]|uniref:uncharacterized protein LOC121865212 n=1 Tax=Homarus americanus TaxID=6706 RepID=UPI001C45B01A|nr:uncharacterized protein LOC121865212 [Homarus americanus]
MAVLSSCLCCSLLLGTIIAGVFTTMVYLAAFILSLWWIVEAEASGSTEGSGGMVNGSTPPIPVPAYLLCFGYLIVTAASIFMLLGLYKKRDRALLLWVFVMTLFCFPEMGMVAFMAFVHWKITSTYGLVDLIFYVFRAAFNVVSVLCVQSQYTTWRDDLVNTHTLKRLHHLHLGSVQQGGVNGETTLAYHNPAFVSSPETPTATLTTSPTSLSRSYSRASQYSVREMPIVRETPLVVGQLAPVRTGVPGWDPYVTRDSQSEFNAAMFSPGSLGFLPLVSGPGSRSEAALHTGPAGGLTVYHHTPQLFYPYPLADQYYSTQSLDRRRFGRGRGVMVGDGLSMRAGLLAGPGLVRPPHESRSSLGAESDDLRKYRDVAL